MKIILTSLATVALISCAYWDPGLVWKGIIQGVSALIILICNISTVYALSEARDKIQSLKDENLSLAADAAENRKNKERARKILGR